MNNSKIAEATHLEAEKKFEEAIALLRVLVNQDPSCADAYIHLVSQHGRSPLSCLLGLLSFNLYGCLYRRVSVLLPRFS